MNTVSKMSTKSSARIKQKRRGEPWISTNRVLNGNGGMKKSGNFSRNPNFDTDETKLLIQLWGDPKVQRTLITTHKKHAVICQLASKMQEYGYYRSPEEITTRIKNLKCFYNRLKKDMDAGQLSATEPSWKHFAEMDAIMTRPIFSVRPNEVPQPSLKYQLEKAREEREERRKKALADGLPLSDSDDGLEDLIALNKVKNMVSNDKSEIDDGIIPDVEVDIDISDEAYVAIANAAERSAKTRKLSKVSSAGDSEEVEVDQFEKEKKICIKEESETSEDSKKTLPDEKQEEPPSAPKLDKKAKKELNGHNSAALLIPKEEPIDVDADDDSQQPPIADHVQAMMPTLAEILKMSKNSSMSIVSSSVVIPVTNPVTTTNTLSSNGNVTTPVSSSNQQPVQPVQQQGKISLVPTNFLMQPRTSTPNSNMPMQTQKIHLLQSALTTQSQQRILLSGKPTQHVPASGPNTGIVTTGPGGMKVLLVNADQTNGKQVGSPQMTANCMAKSLGTVLPLGSTLIPQQQQQQQQHQQQTQQQPLKLQQHKQPLQSRKKKTLYDNDRREKREEHLSKKDTTGMRILLRQLLNAQTENNEIQHQRLSLERERLDFEKSVAERFLTALPNLFTQFLQQQQQPPQHIFQPQQQFTTRFKAPKLVFATATVPTVGSNIPTLITSNTLTTSIAKTAKPVEICTQINDVQLVTPKVEKDD